MKTITFFPILLLLYSNDPLPAQISLTYTGIWVCCLNLKVIFTRILDNIEITGISTLVRPISRLATSLIINTLK